jgi:hypothetical protein
MAVPMQAAAPPRELRRDGTEGADCVRLKLVAVSGHLFVRARCGFGGRLRRGGRRALRGGNGGGREQERSCDDRSERSPNGRAVGGNEGVGGGRWGYRWARHCLSSHERKGRRERCGRDACALSCPHSITRASGITSDRAKPRWPVGARAAPGPCHSQWLRRVKLGSRDGALVCLVLLAQACRRTGWNPAGAVYIGCGAPSWPGSTLADSAPAGSC